VDANTRHTQDHSHWLIDLRPCQHDIGYMEKTYLAVFSNSIKFNGINPVSLMKSITEREATFENNFNIEVRVKQNKITTSISK